MAFNLVYFGQASSTANPDALRVWTYNGTSAGSNETVATIAASGYFNNLQTNLTAGSLYGRLQVGDVIHVHGNDASGMYTVTSITTNVTLGSYAAVESIGTAQIEDDAVTAAKIAAAVAGDGLAGGGGTALSVNVDDSTIETNADTLRVKDDGITNAKLAEDTVQYAEVTIATGAVKTMAASPVELVAAPGADKVAQFLGAVLILDYNSAGYTESADNMAVRYTDGSGVIVSEAIEATGFIDQTADTLTSAIPVKDPIVAASGCVNKALVLDNTGGDEYATGDSPLRVKVTYKVITAGL